MAQASAVTDVGVAAGGLGKTIAAAIVQFQKANVLSPCVTMVPAANGTNVVQFPIYTKHDVTSGTYGVGNLASGAEETAATLTSMETTAISAEVLRNAIRAEISDLAAYGNSDALLVNTGQVLGNDIAKEFDINVCALFDSFSATSNDTTNGISFNDIWQAVALLEAADAPRPYHCVLHPKQMWGAFGLSKETNSLAGGGTFAAGTNKGNEQFFGAGFIQELGGVRFYTSPSVDVTSDNACGAIFSQAALGVGYIDFGGGNFVQLTSERDESTAKTIVVANGYWEEKVLVNGYGVEIKTNVA